MFSYIFDSISRRCKQWEVGSEYHYPLPTGIRLPMTTLPLCVWIIVLAFTLPASALQVEDDRGLIIRFERSPQRIVSLLPSLTETVCALGECHRLVGVDCDSNYPDSVRHLPQVGQGLHPNLEAIVALHPDVVLMAQSSRVDERLQSLGIKVLALEPKTHAGVKRVLEQVGQLLAVPHAQPLWRMMDAAMTAAAQSLPARIKTTRVYFEVNPAPYAASEGSFIGETLQRLGVQNIVPASLGPFPKLNSEYVVRANPDVMMVDDRYHHGIEDRPGWRGIRAIREGRVCVFGVNDNDVVVRPGPRLAEGARIMAQCLQSKAP